MGKKMKKEIVAPNIDFADSEFVSFEQSENQLIIYLKSWDEKTLKINFSNAILFSYRLGYHVSNLYKILDNTSILEEALSEKYVRIPFDHPYFLFQIEDLDNFPFIQVVATTVCVFKD